MIRAEELNYKIIQEKFLLLNILKHELAKMYNNVSVFLKASQFSERSLNFNLRNL